MDESLSAIDFNIDVFKIYGYINTFCLLIHQLKFAFFCCFLHFCH